ncbi:MAG TPA: hypothetical protein DDY37_01680 [Legionella sp.]|nr:hypothetical protein [Legionella sp.]
MCLLYLAFYPTIINTTIAQLGTVIAFFIVMGYYFYTKKRDVLAGVMWGIIIAMKFFPGLLFFYTVKQRRYRVMAIMALTLLVLSIMPGLVYGVKIYSHYFRMLSHLAWYGDNWNASINGFVFRVLTNIHSTPADFFRVKCLYTVLFIVSMVWFLKKLYSSTAPPDKNHQAFCLTLVMMLLMSPFGWMYYFPLLILPLCLTWSEASAAHADKKTIFIWVICLFLITFPNNYVRVNHMHTLFEKLTRHSFYFYGLCLLTYLLARQMGGVKGRTTNPSHASDPLILPIQIILGFGLLVLSIHLILCFGSTSTTLNT